MMPHDEQGLTLPDLIFHSDQTRLGEPSMVMILARMSIAQRPNNKRKTVRLAFISVIACGPYFSLTYRIASQKLLCVRV